MIDVEKILYDIESSWSMGGLSDGMYADYACEVLKAVTHALVTKLTEELGNGDLSIEAIEFRANQLIKYPDS